LGQVVKSTLQADLERFRVYSEAGFAEPH
jgi:uncharacterized membrane protein